MKKIAVVGIVLLCLVLTGITGCAEMPGQSESNGEPVEVERGDLTVTVSGSGNIEVYEELTLTFGVAGRVEEVSVEEGDSIGEGEMLARLDTEALQLAVAQAEVAVTKAGADVTQAKVALKTAEYNLEQAKTTYTLAEIKAVEADISIAEKDLAEVMWTLNHYEEGTLGWENYQKYVTQAQARLDAYQDQLDAMLLGSDTKEVAIKRLQVELAEQSLALAEESLTLAGQSLEYAQKQLADAVVTAPFSGVVARVYIDEQDTVSTASPVIHLIDPGMMELKVDVDEIDIADVKIGQKAVIEVDALSDLELEGEVSSISQLPKEEGGVIIFDVKVRFDAAEGSGLKGGMSASTDIIVKERTGVLLVPSRAVKKNSDGDTVVEVVSGGKTEEKKVVTGISDGFDTEIVSGLSGGEMVSIR
jgi:HlyD family secretion protein